MPHIGEALAMAASAANAAASALSAVAASNAARLVLEGKLGNLGSTPGSTSTTTGVASTIYSLPGITGGAYLIVCDVLSGAPTLYNAVSLVTTDNGVARLTPIQTASNTVITLAGLDVQVTQSSGVGQSVIWTVTRIA